MCIRDRDKIDNQVFYSDRGSLDILQYYLEKQFWKTINFSSMFSLVNDTAFQRVYLTDLFFFLGEMLSFYPIQSK